MPLLMPLFDDAVLKRRAEIVAALKRIVPGEGVIASEQAMRPFESDGLSSLCHSALASGRPASSDRSPVSVVFSQAAICWYWSISSRPDRIG